MQYRALALDFDGTLATSTAACTPRRSKRSCEFARPVGASSWRPDGSYRILHSTFAHLDLFEMVVAENGGLMYRPSTATRTSILGPPPPCAFVDALRARAACARVGGRGHRRRVRSTPFRGLRAVIRDLGLELDVILNKGAVIMVLPAGVKQGDGSNPAAAKLALPLSAMVGIGDAENDCALTSARAVWASQWRTPSHRSRSRPTSLREGPEAKAQVVEIIDRRLVMNDLAGHPSAVTLGRGISPARSSCSRVENACGSGKGAARPLHP